jgi:hypothetical protein
MSHHIIFAMRPRIRYNCIRTQYRSLRVDLLVEIEKNRFYLQIEIDSLKQKVLARKRVDA